MAAGRAAKAQLAIGKVNLAARDDLVILQVTVVELGLAEVTQMLPDTVLNNLPAAAAFDKAFFENGIATE